MLENTTILLIIILSPVIVFVGFLVGLIVFITIGLILFGTTELVGWIVGKLKK